MDDIKSKVIKFVKKGNQSEQHKDEEEAEDSDSIRQSVVMRSKPLNDEIDAIEDDEVLEKLPSYFYNASPDFDVQHHILKELPPGIKCQEIKIQLRTLYRQHNVVSKKTLRQILEKESSCQTELERVGEVQSELAQAITACKESRLQVKSIRNKFTLRSLGLLKNVKRKQTLNLILADMKTIRTLQKSEEKVASLLKIGDYPSVIRLLIESQGVAASRKHFKCVAQLSWKLQDTLENAESHLDTALSQMCKDYNDDTYCNLHEAYELLDKTQTLIDQLLMHFTSELHSSVFKVVHSYVPATSTKQFQHLCKMVPSKEYVNCLQQMCREIWQILNSYYKVLQWHQQREKELTQKKVDSPLGRDIEKSLSRQYVKQKLENGQTRIWNDSQSRISAYILGHDFSDCKFEDLLQILGILHRLVEIGEELCGSKSEDITKCIRQQTVSYFQSYHAAKLEELRIFLENESWTPCPVRKAFNLTHLQEFKSLRHSIESYRKHRKEVEPSGNESESRASVSNLSTEGSSCQNGNFFYKYQDANSGTPFDVPLDETFQEDILDMREDLSGYFSDSSEETDSEELKKTYVEENPSAENAHAKKKRDKSEPKSKQVGPLLCNTTLTVLRHCGKYLQMSRLLKPIAMDVVWCMCQLLDYYLYNVHRFFTADLHLQAENMLSPKLKAALKRIDDNLILNGSSDDKPQDTRKRIEASHLSEMVNLNSKETLHGLTERVVGVESLVFLGKQFEYIQPYVFHLVPDEKRHFIEQFYSQTVASVSDLRRPAYMCVSEHVVDMRQTVMEIKSVNFDVNDITSQHSPYVDKIVRDMQIFAMKLEELDIDISTDTEIALWENVMHIVNNILVDGFSLAKKCGDSGRALMLLDYTQLVSKVQKMTPLQKMPNREFVEKYIKAYYLQENNLEEWILQNREYSNKQLEGLVNLVCQKNKKTRQRLLQLLETGR